MELPERLNIAEFNLLKLLDHKKNYLSGLSDEQKLSFTGRLVQKEFTVIEIYYKTSCEAIRQISADLSASQLINVSEKHEQKNDHLFSSCYKSPI